MVDKVPVLLPFLVWDQVTPLTTRYRVVGCHVRLREYEFHFKIARISLIKMYDVLLRYDKTVLYNVISCTVTSLLVFTK